MVPSSSQEIEDEDPAQAREEVRTMNEYVQLALIAILFFSAGIVAGKHLL